MSERPTGPFYLVHLEDDDPWIESIAIEQVTYYDDEGLYTDQQVKSFPFNGGTLTPLHPRGGSSLTLDELLALPDGEQMLGEFMRGDTTKRDRAALPSSMEMMREDITKFPDRCEEERAHLARMERRWAEVSA